MYKRQSLKKLEEGVKGGWIRGIKLYPYAEHFMLDDDAINPVYETCLALDIPVLLHVGFQRSSLVHPSQVGAAPCKLSLIHILQRKSALREPVSSSMIPKVKLPKPIKF